MWENTTLIRNLARFDFSDRNTEIKKFDISTDTMLSYVVSPDRLEIYENASYVTDIPVSSRLFNILASYFNTGVAINKRMDAQAHVEKFNELSKKHLKG